MTPDRTLDDRIAQFVMGWERVEVNRGLPKDPQVLFLRHHGKNSKHPRPAPKFSTFMGSAWQIVEHLRAQDWDYELLNDGSRHYAVFSRKTEDAYSASADTAAAAIVAAALKAVEVT